MHNRFSRTLTALVVVFGLWAGSLTALASTLPAQQGAQQTPAKQESSGQEGQKSGGDTTATHAPEAGPEATEAGLDRAVAGAENQQLIGERNRTQGSIV